MNKYQKEFNKFQISDSVKEKISTKLEIKNSPRIKLYPIILATLLLCIFTLIITNDQKIKEVFNEPELPTVSEKEENGLVKTNYDDLILDKEFTEKYHNELNNTSEWETSDYYLNVTRFENKTIEEIEKNIGIDLVTLDDNLKYNYDLTVTEEGKISKITIYYSELYEINCIEECGKYHDDDKYINFTAELYTTNNTTKVEYKEKESNIYEVERRTIKLATIPIEGHIYSYKFTTTNQNNSTYYTELIFNYQNIRYIFYGNNVTPEEMTSYTNQLK